MSHLHPESPRPHCVPAPAPTCTRVEQSQGPSPTPGTRGGPSAGTSSDASEHSVRTPHGSAATKRLLGAPGISPWLAPATRARGELPETSRPDLTATNQPLSLGGNSLFPRPPTSASRGALWHASGPGAGPQRPPKCTRGSQSLKACPEGAKPAPEFAGVKPSGSQAEPELLRGRPCPHSCRRGAGRRSCPGHTVATKKPGPQILPPPGDRAPSRAPASRKPTPTGRAAHARTGLKPLSLPVLTLVGVTSPPPHGRRWHLLVQGRSQDVLAVGRELHKGHRRVVVICVGSTEPG